MRKLTLVGACTIFMSLVGFSPAVFAENQTATVSKIYPDSTLPYRIRLERADFKLPKGLQSYIHGVYRDKWLLITGRVGGLHGFVNDSIDNFPVSEQNTEVFVIDPIKKKVYSRSLHDPKSGLTQAQVDLLSVTAAQGYQWGRTLYIAGGYGVDTATGEFNTKDALTAIDIPGLIHWVMHPSSRKKASRYIRQIFDDIFKVTGGYMNQTGDHPTLLVMGQEFNGFYMDPMQSPPVFQQYTEQVRRFRIHDDGKKLSITAKKPLPEVPDPNYRRRDLNVVPIVKRVKDKLENSYIVLSGVFTPTDGIWTVPVEVTAQGAPSMADPLRASTFKQGMNNYDCATFGLFSEKSGDMYVILLGGISYGFIDETKKCLTFNTDDEIPFISQTTTVRIDKHGQYKQYFMAKGGFPFIASKTVNPGNQLLFGAEAEVILFDSVCKYSNDVLKLDAIKKPTVIGYVVGGIQSTLPNTNTQADSAPSKYLFKVIVEPAD